MHNGSSNRQACLSGARHVLEQIRAFKENWAEPALLQVCFMSMEKKKKKDSQLMFVCGKCFSVLGPCIVCSKRNPYLSANQQQAFPFVTFWRFCYSLSWLLQNGYCHSSTLGHLRNNKRFLCNTVHFSLIFHLEINLKKI